MCIRDSLEGMSYSKLMGGLHKAGIEINRKVLADLEMCIRDRERSLF